MIWTVVEEQLIDKNVKRHAGGKAREDLHSIFLKCGIEELILRSGQIERVESNLLKKAMYHITVKQDWERLLDRLAEGDKLILQFPVINHTLLLNRVIKKTKERGVLVYAFIHDLNCLRLSNEKNTTKIMQWRINREEIEELYEFDGIVVHNEAMKLLMSTRFGLDENKLINLGIFDYLIPNFNEQKRVSKNYNSCIIAGNLHPEKAEYIYKLPDSPEFELFGVNFDEHVSQENIHYHGSFPPDELPKHLIGGFGLVWDGNAINTCSGSWGEYLKYNNPHKTSLYLACGIPVIIWEEAALADYIREHQVGITIKTITELSEAISKVTKDQYAIYKKNAIEISKELRAGENTNRALKSLGVIRFS